jgi:hypothetical protein
MRNFLIGAFLILSVSLANAEPKFIEMEKWDTYEFFSHYYPDQKRIEALGEGFISRKKSPIGVRKQEAFVDALLGGVRNIAEEIAKLKKTHRFKTIKSKKSGKDIETLFFNIREKVGDFEIDSQSIIEDATIKDDLININYKGQQFVIKNFELISPPVEFVDFIKWNNPPKKISVIEIKGIQWNEKEGEVALLISYPFDAAKSRKIGKEAKTLDFEFQKDNSGNFVYKTVTIEGLAHGGGEDTPDAMRKKALNDGLRNAVENVNGVFIQSLTEVENSTLSKDEIISQSLGIAQVIDKKFNPRFTSEGNFEMVCTVTAKVPLVRIIAKD